MRGCSSLPNACCSSRADVCGWAVDALAVTRERASRWSAETLARASAERWRCGFWDLVSERLSGTLGAGDHGRIEVFGRAWVRRPACGGAQSAVDVEAHPQLDARAVALAHDELVAGLGDDAQARAQARRSACTQPLTLVGDDDLEVALLEVCRDVKRARPGVGIGVHDDVGRRFGDGERDPCLKIAIGAELGRERNDPPPGVANASGDRLGIQADTRDK